MNHGTRSMPVRSLPFRSRLASFLYSDATRPFFRWGFTAFARARTRPPFREHATVEHDPLLAPHIRKYYAGLWSFGYHRVHSVLQNLDAGLDRRELTVLSIGPRTEIELYYLWLFFGFEWSNIVGVDLVSASPKIKVGDMGDRLPFADDTFDVVVASHCLEKSRDPARTRDEIRRVTRAGGRVCVAGTRPTEAQLRQTFEIPVQLFHGGLSGFVELYKLRPEEIEYSNAVAPGGFEIIFRVSK
jgi:SAM-dependent methyltransferase